MREEEGRKGGGGGNGEGREYGREGARRKSCKKHREEGKKKVEREEGVGTEKGGV
jgi:hypothetical protein